MTITQHLIVEEYGAFISKHSERIIVKRKDEKLAQAPLLHLESILIASMGVSISADAVRECTERGIPIHFMSSTGTPYASLYSSGLTGTVITRRAQLTAFNDRRGLFAVLAFITGKLQNQTNLLKYMSKYRKETAPDLYEELRLRADEVYAHLAEIDQITRYPEVCQEGTATIDQLRGELLSIEGRAAQKYWSAIKLVLPEELNWPGRKGRGATDPINGALNYGYGILYGQVERAIVLAGLDPYAGFMHVDRPGKPSLVLDLIEEFRQTVVDRCVLAYFNKGQRLAMDAQGRIEEESRRRFAEKVLERLEAAERVGKEHLTLRAILQRQARAVAGYLREEREMYESYTAAW